MKLDHQLRLALDNGFQAAFGCAPERYFSAPGRTEIGGNHTDHQRIFRGCGDQKDPLYPAGGTDCGFRGLFHGQLDSPVPVLEQNKNRRG